MSTSLISRSADLKRLRDEGFNVGVSHGFVLLRDIPYVNSLRQVLRGTLVAKLTLVNDITAAPEDHVACWIGEYPCRHDGQPIDPIRNESKRTLLADGLEIDHRFSAKPATPYPDFYAKLTRYVSIISPHARAIDPTASAQTFAVVEATEQESVFNYVDTASSRAEIDVVTNKLSAGVVGIVGLGGTGSYVLDLVAKTPVQEIHLFDGDTFLQHNAFRAPGAPSGQIFGEKLRKVHYFHGIYSRMRRRIIPHDQFVDPTNVEQLRRMTFVFLCLDRGGDKRVIIERLEEWGVPFSDVGMGVTQIESALRGTLRITTSTPTVRDHVRARVPLSDGAPYDEYRTNIQIADLNTLSAALAVIKWKKLAGFYADLEHEHHCMYTIDGNVITNEVRV